MVPGSYLVISRVTADNATPRVTAGVKHLYQGVTAPGAPRTRSEILRLFSGLELVMPGLVNVSEWRNELMPEQLAAPSSTRAWGRNHRHALSRGILRNAKEPST
jgi:hypothetical protein